MPYRAPGPTASPWNLRVACLSAVLALALAGGGGPAATAAGSAAAPAAAPPAAGTSTGATPPAPAPAPGPSTIAPVQAPASSGATCVPAVASVVDAYKEPPPPTPGSGSGGAAANGTTGADQAAAAGPKVRLVRLGDVLVVELDSLPQLQALLAEEKCSRRAIVLFLDERPIKDALPFPPTDPSRPQLRFSLRRTEQPQQAGQASPAGGKVDDPREVWTYVLGGPSWDPRPTRVSVGFADGFAFPSKATVGFEVIPHGPFVLGALLLVVLLIGFFALAAKSDLLRDSAPLPGGGARRPFSLSRTQAAWWFFLTLASYLFIGEITGDFSSTITGTVLVLLGISAGTAVGAAAVDASQSKPSDVLVQSATAQAIAAQVEQLEAEVKNLQSSAQGQTDPQVLQVVAAKSLDLAQKRSQLKKLRNESETFLVDILSDANGVNFHRFQVAAWTVVLGIIFVAQVYRVLAMPTFDSSLLALMGISSGTYVSLKITEPTVPTQVPPAPVPPPAR